MAQGVLQSWTALYAVLQGLFTDQGQLVCQGDPGVYEPDLVVSMMALRTPITQPTAGATRSRDKRAEIDVSISSFVGGGPEAQDPAIEAAIAAADTIEGYFRVRGNETLSGACYNAFAESENLTPATAWQQPEGVPEPVAVGRLAQIEMVVRVWIRI